MSVFRDETGHGSAQSANALASSQWRQALADFGDELAASDRSPATCAGYMKHLTWLAADCSRKSLVGSDFPGPWDLTSAQLGKWLDGHGWSGETRRKVLVSLKTFYGWACAEGRTDWSPCAGLPTLAPQKRGPKRKGIRSKAWAEPVAAFLSWNAAGGRSADTLRVYEWRLTVLSEQAADPWKVTTAQLSAWLANPDWRSPEMKKSMVVAVRAFYRWAVREGRTTTNPTDGLAAVRIPRALPRPAPREALQSALMLADDRQRLAILLAAYAGLRRSEIAGLHMRDFKAGHVTVTGKGGHTRRVPLHPVLASEIAAERSRRRAGGCGSGWHGEFCTVDGWVFPSDLRNEPMSPWTIADIICECLPDGLTTHQLRHYFASRAYQTTHDIRAVQQLLGHASVATTERYTQIENGALAAAVAGVGL
jgi:integrase/recombinase XerC